VIDASYPDLREDRRRVTEAVLRGAFADQQFDVLVAGKRLGKEWDDRLAARILDVNLATARAIGDRVAAALRGEFNPALTYGWLLANAEIAANSINTSTRDALANAEDKPSVFDGLAVLAVGYAESMVTTIANFAAKESAQQSDAGTKTWISSGKPRHAGMNGETVPLAANFSNGMAWPGDPDGGAEEVAHCHCSIGFN
jgi:hypothetical protein